MPDNLGRISKEQWDDGYEVLGQKGAARRFIRYRIDNYSSLNYRLNILFNRYLASGSMSLLDIGCGAGKWLVYFNRQFGYEVYGVDYSERACEVAKETLKRNAVQGKVICTDVFDSSFQSQYKQYFDVVLSMGVVEHFDDPTAIIDAHLNLLKTGGHIIITVPNLGDGSFYRIMARMYGREEEIVKEHNVALIKTASLGHYLKKYDNLDIEMLGYIGGVSLVRATYGVAWPSWFRHFHLIYALDQIIGYATFCFKSPFLSHTLAFVGKKH